MSDLIYNNYEKKEKKKITTMTKRTPRSRNSYSFWKNLEKNCKIVHHTGKHPHYNQALKSSSGVAATSHHQDSTKKRENNTINKLNEHHLTIDQLVARRKLEQLRQLTQTDLAILNSAEPYRVSSYLLFKRYLLDISLYTLICFIYFSCKLLTWNSNRLSFIVLFISIFSILNHHIESYRSFVNAEKSARKLSKNHQFRRKFLSTHLGYDPRSKRNAQLKLEQDEEDRHQQTKLLGANKRRSPSNRFDNNVDIRPAQVLATLLPLSGEPTPETTIDTNETKDSFRWINRIIIFFWPYLSHLIHYELNEFFKEKIESGTMARSDEGSKRLFYAIIRQLDTNVLVIEKCQLGAQTPLIKNLTAIEAKKVVHSSSKLPEVKVKKEIGKKEEKKKSKSAAKKLQVDFSTMKTVLSDLMSPPSKSSRSSSGSRSKRGNDDDDDDDDGQVNSNQSSSLPTSEDKVSGGGGGDGGRTLVYNLNLVYNGDMDISVIYRYFCCCSSRVGLKDVFLRFNIQLTLGPLNNEIPFIEEISFTLLELPDFGYKGIALAELTELKIIRRLINRMIKDHLLYPKAVSINVHDIIETLINGPSKLRRGRQNQDKSRQSHNDHNGQSDPTKTKQPGAAAAAADDDMSKKQPETMKREESMSRIEPHPGKIMSSSERAISVSMTVKTINNNNNEENNLNNRLSFWTRLQASALICGCMSLNCLLRCCQCWGRASTPTPPPPPADDNATNASLGPGTMQVSRAQARPLSSSSSQVEDGECPQLNNREKN